MEKYLSSNLTWLLKQHNLSTSALSRHCNIAQPVMHRLVVGSIDNPQVNTLLPICQYFNCSLDSLLFENLAETCRDLAPGKTKIRHAMNNHLSIINSMINGLEKTLPIFLQTYSSIPSEHRTENISDDVLKLLPQMLNHTLKAITQLKENIQHL